MRSENRRRAQLGLLALSTSACGHAPSFNLVGSYFPAWLVCIPLAILLTIALRLLVRRMGVESYLRPVFLSYIAAWALFTFSLWLLFFS